MRFLRTESRESIFLSERMTPVGSSILAFFPAFLVTLGGLFLLWNRSLNQLLLHETIKKRIE